MVPPVSSFSAWTTARGWSGAGRKGRVPSKLSPVFQGSPGVLGVGVGVTESITQSERVQLVYVFELLFP